MSNNKVELPKDYIAYHTLTVCTNKMVNGQVPITLKTGIPFLVGKGTIPLIWLSVPTSKEATNWKYIVEKNQTKDDRVSIVLTDTDKSLRIMFQNINLMQVNGISDDEAEISYLDLRPVGLNVYGDTSGLFVGTNRLKGNSFNSVYGMVKID